MEYVIYLKSTTRNSKLYSGIFLNCWILKKKALRIFKKSETIYTIQYFGLFGSFTLNVIYCALLYYYVLRRSRRRRTGNSNLDVVFVGDGFIFSFFNVTPYGKIFFLKTCHWDVHFSHYISTFLTIKPTRCTNFSNLFLK